MNEVASRESSKVTLVVDGRGKRRWVTGRRVLVGVLVVVSSMGIAVAAYTLAHSRWFRMLVARAEGYVIIVDEPQRRLSAIPGETVSVEFLLTNVTNEEVTVIGAQTGCGCASVDPLPLSLPARSSKRLKVTFDMKGRDPDSVFEMSPRLFVNRPSPDIVLGVTIDLNHGIAISEKNDANGMRPTEVKVAGTLCVPETVCFLLGGRHDGACLLLLSDASIITKCGKNSHFARPLSQKSAPYINGA